MSNSRLTERRMVKFCLNFFILSLVYIQTNADTPHMFRRLHKNGYHRELYTSIKWTVKPHMKTDVQNCGMLFVETLPSGMYVDPFQLKNMLKFSGTKVLVDAPVNIEKPEHLSPEHILHVYTDLKLIRHSSQGSLLSGSVTVPVHLRYHRPTDNPRVTHVDVVAPNPRFYINCTVKESVGLLQAPCDHTNASLCLWQEYLYHSDKNNVVCSVPVGNQNHLSLVVIATITTTCGGSLFIIYIVFYKHTVKKMKVS